MPEGFRSLTEILRAAEPDPEPEQDECVIEEMPAQRQTDAVRDACLFRAALGDALESSLAELLEDIAADVLARELNLSGANVQAIVNRALERFDAAQPVRVRLNASDAAYVRAGIPIVADNALLPGDAIVELRAGSIDARLGTRLSCVLAEFVQ